MQRVLNFLKRRILQYRFLLIGVAVLVLLLPQISPTQETAPDIIYFIGRFHPLIIHFPVVLVLLTLVLEIIRRWRLWPVSQTTLAFLLGIGWISSVIAMGFGFMLYYTGEYVGDAMQQHLWGGSLLTAALSLSLYFFLSFLRSGSHVSQGLYLGALILANLMVIFTSHQGGSLTHGSEYLTEYLPDFTQTTDEWQPKPVEEMLVYEDMIVPFLDQKCMSCHNPNKAKGGLVMTSYEGLLKGGKSELPTLMPGSVDDSELYRRVMLPVEDEDHMPPEGKTPLNEEEITLLRWWIEKGAEPQLKVQQATAEPHMKPLVDNYLTQLQARQRARFLQRQALEQLIQTVSTSQPYVLQMDAQEETLTLSMTFPPTSFKDEDLLSVQHLFPRISKASFIGSNITDDALYHIGQMPALRELYLQQTAIDGSGLVHLSGLPHLQLLDLSKTQINDGQLLHVLHLPGLEELYLHETSVSEEIVAALQQNRPDLNIHLERGRLF